MLFCICGYELMVMVYRNSDNSEVGGFIDITCRKGCMIRCFIVQVFSWWLVVLVMVGLLCWIDCWWDFSLLLNLSG